MTRIFQITRFAGQWLAARVKSERGATAVEYGIMVALIAAVILVAVAWLGTNASQTFQCSGNSIAARKDLCAPAPAP